VKATDEPIHGRPIEITDISSENESLLSLISMNLFDENVANQVAKSLATAIQAQTGKPFTPTSWLKSGKRYSIYLDENGGFRKATIELEPSNVFHCVKDGDSYRSWKEDVVLEYRVETLSFQVKKDFLTTILGLHESKELSLKLTHIFRWDIDFQSDPRMGDVCKIVFERRYADDTPAGYGRILFATYEGKRTGKKTALLFNGQYYDENGVELRKDYLRAPLNVLRVTSGYGWRIHPVLNVWKFHTGVDYGAPIGTPVYAIANGVVTFQGWGEAYGLWISVRHENGFESRYSHLSKILVKKGQRVSQREVIGLIGSTGRSTGPHLFFEIITKGKRIDPTKVKLVKNPAAIPTDLKSRFNSILSQETRLLPESVVRTADQSQDRKTRSIFSTRPL
ncbi:MAG: M23 family metallopeptidase, partial [Desulfomonilaceae bacterium]